MGLKLIAIFVSLAVLSGMPLALADDSSVREDHEHEEKQMAEFPKLPAAHIGQVVALRLDRNDLALTTRLRPTDGTCRIRIPELPGLCSVDIRIARMNGAPPVAGDPYVPRQFTLIHWIFDEQASKESAITVAVNPISLQISCDSEFPSGNQSVSLIQSAPGLALDEAPVRLNVSGMGQAPLRWTAPDFVTLRRKYPAETTTYLEPIFRQLHADGLVFMPDSKLLWQVFAAESKSDPLIDRQTQEIVHQMDSDDFRRRESATADLEKLGQSAAASLWHMNRAGLSPEQNNRIDAFLLEYQPVTEQDVIRLRSDTTFLLECLYSTDDFLVNEALARLEQVTGRKVHFDRTLRDEPRRAAVNTLREMLLPAATQPVDPAN